MRKSKLYPFLVGAVEFLKNPLVGAASAPVAMEQYWDQLDHGKETGEILASVKAIHGAMNRLSDADLDQQLAGLGLAGELTADDVRAIVRRRARRLGLIPDDQRLQKYRERLARDFQSASFAGLVQQIRLVSLPLDEVFVPLSAVPEASIQPRSQEERELLARLEGARDRRERDAVEARLAELGHAGWHSRAEGRLPVADLLAERTRVVVLGDPGSGKTTLIKWLARQCALQRPFLPGVPTDLIPVIMPIAGYGRALESDRQLLLHRHLAATLDESDDTGFGDLILEEMEAGRCLILLDGLDEIPDPRLRLLSARGVDALMSRFPACRYVVTSRIVGYGICRISQEARHYVLSGFTDDEIRLFAKQWWEACERALHPGSPDLPGARRQADALSRAVFDHAHPQVKEFARNPLLLTILALINWQGVSLPEKRVELYRAALDALMASWLLARSMAGPAQGVALDLKESLGVWQQIAYWMHDTKPSGTVFRDELVSELVQALMAEGRLTERDAEQTAQSFIGSAAEQAGLLQERGQNVFGFLHQTFQEYLAARHVARPLPTAFSRVYDRLHNPRWREVVLLAAGYIGAVLEQPEVAGDFVRSILTRGSLHEEVLHRDLLLAAECIAERVPVDPQCQREVLGALTSILARADTAPEVRQLGADVLGRCDHLRPEDGDLSALVALSQAQDDDVRAAAVIVLSGAHGDAATDALRRALRDRDPQTGGIAALGLLHRGVVTRPVVRALSRAIIGDWGNVADSLVAELAQHDDKRRPVMSLLHADASRGGARLKCQASAALAFLAIDESELSPIRGMVRDAHPDVRERAIYDLAHGNVRPHDMESLLAEQLRDGRRYARQGALLSLWNLGPLSPGTKRAVVACTCDADPEVRELAAWTIQLVGLPNAETARLLTRLASDVSAGVREAALSALARSDPAWAEHVAAMLVHPHAARRVEAVWACASASPQRPHLVAGVLGRLDDRSARVRAAVAGALRVMPVPPGARRSAIVRSLGDPRRSVRSAIVSVLTDADRSDAAILKALVSIFADPCEEENLRSDAATRLLWGGQRLDPAPLLSCATPGERSLSVRRLAARLLPKADGFDGRSEQQLRHLGADPDPDIRYWATYALAQWEETQ